MSLNLKKISGMILLPGLFIGSVLLWSGCDALFPERITKRAESFQKMCDYFGIAHLFRAQKPPFSGEVYFTFRTDGLSRSGVVVGKSDLSWDDFRRLNPAENDFPKPVFLPENIVLPKNFLRYERLNQAKYYESTLKSSGRAILYWSVENNDLILVWGFR